MSMHMNAEFKKEQIATLFCLVGALEGGLGGGWSLRGVHPNKVYVPSKKNILFFGLIYPLVFTTYPHFAHP
jgi:hypothetical protein